MDSAILVVTRVADLSSLASDDIAISADDNGTFSTTTAVYLFHRSQAAWKQVVRIQNPIADYTGFGEAVSLRADTLVVGAAEGLNSGSAWLIERDASGAWGTPLLLSPLRGESIPGGHVGEAIATDAMTIVIGMPGVGMTRISSRSDQGWETPRWFKPPRTGAYSHLGSAVAVDGERIVVADHYDGLRARNAGAVYVH